MTALAGILLSGCAAVKPAVPSVTYVSPEAALGALSLPVPSAALTATARIEILTRSERYPLKAALILKEPASLRLESIPLLGPPDFVLTLHDGQLRAYFPQRGTFYAGPATPRTLSRFLPLAMPPAEIVPLMMGRPPAEDPLARPVLKGGKEEGLYRVDQIVLGAKARSLWIDPAGGRLAKVRTFAADGRVLYTAEFDEHIRVGNAWTPQRLVITGQDGSVRIAYTDIAPLEEEADVFVLLPEGITPIPLD